MKPRKNASSLRHVNSRFTAAQVQKNDVHFGCSVSQLSAQERNVIEGWAAHCFQSLLFNLGSPHQHAAVFQSFGMDPDRVIEAMRATATDKFRRDRMQNEVDIFRV